MLVQGWAGGAGEVRGGDGGGVGGPAVPGHSLGTVTLNSPVDTWRGLGPSTSPRAPQRLPRVSSQAPLVPACLPARAPLGKAFSPTPALSSRLGDRFSLFLRVVP